MKELVRIISQYKKKITAMEIGWEAVADVFKTRSSVDCRTRWSYIINHKVAESLIYSQNDDLLLFRAIRKQGVRKIEDVDFEGIGNGKAADENRFRFKVLAKAMSGRLRLSLGEVLDKLEYSYEKAKPVEADLSILDYYANNYSKD